jgi:hypothetical protein
MKLSVLIVSRCQRDKEFKRQVLKTLNKRMSAKKVTAECQMKLLRAIRAIEKL